MATPTTLPRSRSGLSGRWLVGGIILIVIAILAALFLGGAIKRPSTAVAAPASVPVTRGNLTATVAGSGSVAAEDSVNLGFQGNGPVTQVLAKEGDSVVAGQVLARLDDRQLQLQIVNAQAALDSAKARQQQTQQGNARPEDLAAAQAAVTSAQANFDRVSGGPTASDRAAALAALSSARAAYQAAVNSGGTTNSQLEAAGATVQKTQAALAQAQSAYDQVKSNSMIGMLPQSLQLQQATIDYQQAKANYEALQQTSGSDAQSKTQSAAAQVAQAQANLAKLTPSAEDLTAAKASLDQAKANLAKLTSAGTASDLAIQQAAVAQADAALKQAQLNLDNASLKAPFDGIISQVNVVTGSLPSAAQPAIQMINRNPLHVDLKLSENDVAQVQLGQPVTLAIASLNNWKTTGNVSYVAPAAQNSNGVVTYAVRVSFPDTDPKVKVGMTSDLVITTAQKDKVLLVPNSALLPKGAGRAVQVLTTDAQGRPVTTEVDVQTGLSDGVNTEITSGLTEGQQVVAVPDQNAPRRPGSGFFGG
jgi:HlyD family secretion protein